MKRKKVQQYLNTVVVPEKRRRVKLQKEASILSQESDSTFDLPDIKRGLCPLCGGNIKESTFTERDGWAKMSFLGFLKNDFWYHVYECYNCDYRKVVWTGRG